jgi:hypothetical protein
MIKAMVMLLQRDKDEIGGLGELQFLVMPRVGEHITRDVEGIGQIYQVIVIHHPDEPTFYFPDKPTMNGAMGDIYVVHVGNLLDHLKLLNSGLL